MFVVCIAYLQNRVTNIFLYIWRILIVTTLKKLITKFIMAGMVLLPFFASAQECEYSIDDKTEGQELKTTPDYLMHEKVFGGTSQFVFFSLSNSQGVPVVNFQLLSKSKDFAKIYCLDSTSKIYIQLASGRIVTLLCATQDQCSNMVYDSAENNNIRVLTGAFLFTKGTMEDLTKSPITFIRVKYTTETVDYPIKGTLPSEAMGKTYNPDSYFMKFLKCIE